MSWDQQALSFGDPNAQHPTPIQTPTSGQFPIIPTIQTPKDNSSFDDRGGWTPTYAEEYSVFNATPGRLTSSRHHFAEASSPNTSVDSTQKGQSTASFAADLTSHVHQFSPNTNFPLPPVDPSNQFVSSPGLYPTTQRCLHDKINIHVTPKKPKKRLEEAFSAQTATPPATKSKGSRRLAPKLPSDTMQNDSQDNQFGASHTPTHQQRHMHFTSSSAELYYPISASATAPVFTNEKPFWDPDASMGGMNLDFNTEDHSIFNMGSHKMDSSIDWGRNNQMFQENLDARTPSLDRKKTNGQTTIKRPRSLAPKLPKSVPELLPSTIAPFDFSSVSVSDDPFSPTLAGVDPGLLLTRNHLVPMPSEFSDVSLPPTRPATSHVDQLQPYQHQLRELKRDQEELRRSRSSRENSRTRRVERGIASSPVKGSARPGLPQSISDIRGKRSQGKNFTVHPQTSQFSSQERILSRTSSGRISPRKPQQTSNLMSIPEMERPRARTEVKFTIDANGRARTETVLVEADPRTSQGGPSRSNSRESSQYDEFSSDDEPLLIPSRSASFFLPQAKPPNMGNFDTSRGRHRQRRSSSGYSQSESSSQRSLRRNSFGSDAETVMEEDDGSGDAAQALRRVVESRKKGKMRLRNPQQHRYADSTPRGNFQYSGYTSISLSPTTITDPDGGATPSSTKSANPATTGYMLTALELIVEGFLRSMSAPFVPRLPT
ncbi:PHD-finger domain-containing protein [Diplocarpon rosae]|nr:PHD-finger domain-containing protein [Diplocarpon rosae]